VIGRAEKGRCLAVRSQGRWLWCFNVIGRVVGGRFTVIVRAMGLL